MPTRFSWIALLFALFGCEGTIRSPSLLDSGRVQSDAADGMDALTHDSGTRGDSGILDSAGFADSAERQDARENPDAAESPDALAGVDAEPADSARILDAGDDDAALLDTASANAGADASVEDVLVSDADR